jgi:hypothetical protein
MHKAEDRSNFKRSLVNWRREFEFALQRMFGQPVKESDFDPAEFAASCPRDCAHDVTEEHRRAVAAHVVKQLIGPSAPLRAVIGAATRGRPQLAIGTAE